MRPWLSVVIPTVGRDSLRNTLGSIAAQRESEGVEILVVADTFGGLTTDQELVHTRATNDGYRFQWHEHSGGLHCFGQPQRTYGARRAKAPYVWFSQDDNIAAEGALSAIKTMVAIQDRPRPMFFRFVAPWRETIWRIPALALGNIDADCLVFPREIARRVVWGLRYEGDYDAAERAYELADGDVAWCDEVVSIARPNDTHTWWKR